MLISNDNYVQLLQLQLTNFRNYQARCFDFPSKITAIYGPNGVGKTNILEAISLLGNNQNLGQGLKGADFEEIVNNQNLGDNFTIYGKINHHPHIENIGLSYSKSDNKKTLQINHQICNRLSRQSVSKAGSKILPAIIWLTPQMDNLFCFPKNIRRKFLDKIVSDIDIHHQSRINAYNQSIKERINLLINFGINQTKWLEIVEQKIAELGIAIASARNEATQYINKAIVNANNNFIKTQIKIIGELEEMALNSKAIEVEEKFMQKLRENRDLDLRSGRTNFGVHRSDFTAILINKNIEAKFCSTGEQKSILIAITFARTRLFPLLNLPSAILLLDEIVSHLDDEKRDQLLQEISQLNCQSFLSATNQKIFSFLSYFEKKITSFLQIK
jgi:DNA replication and repair protein RecF